MEEIVTAELNERNLWVLIESLPEGETALYNYLRGLADAFKTTPKVYGKGYGIKVRESR